ncbi:Methionyl-tRNA formyltransferase [Vanrija albida]|uniref:methionyl-tRNA formyltransferase n=1 Tax=Vanrija albida TaxID=181172 RepID=A0ABR3QF75_9TREE
MQRLAASANAWASASTRAARPPLAHHLARRCTRQQSTTSTAEPFKILFCGSDAFSVAALDAVLAAEDVWQSIVVLSPPDQLGGRGRREVFSPPIKRYAIERGLTVHDVPRTGLKGATFPHPFERHDPAHLLLTASFGHIVPTPLLEPFGHALNVHPSLLPKYRGAAPVQWAIANGDKHTGVSVQTVGKREAGVDSGAILGAVEGVPIPPDATYSTLLPDLSHVGSRLLVAVLRQLLRGESRPHAQDVRNVTRAPKVTGDTARVNWGQHSATTVERRHRAFGHQAPLWAELGGSSVQLLGVAQAQAEADVGAHAPGTALLDRTGRRLLIATVADGAGPASWLGVTRIKTAGKKELDAAEWWNGLPKADRQQGFTLFV